LIIFNNKFFGTHTEYRVESTECGGRGLAGTQRSLELASWLGIRMHCAALQKVQQKSLMLQAVTGTLVACHCAVAVGMRSGKEERVEKISLKKTRSNAIANLVCGKYQKG